MIFKNAYGTPQCWLLSTPVAYAVDPLSNPEAAVLPADVGLAFDRKCGNPLPRYAHQIQAAGLAPKKRAVAGA
jgi:hypothetical protein